MAASWESGRGGLAGKRVLIVDDNRTNRRILKIQAERWGMHARETGSPLEALEWIRRGDPCDAVLLDYQMPDMDGIMLAREIRAWRGAEVLALILLSSIGQSLPIAHEAGLGAVLSKPLKLSPDLSAAASFHLSLNTCGSSSAPARNVRTIAPMPERNLTQDSSVPSTAEPTAAPMIS